MALSYVYKWTHIPTMMWYVGSRTARGCYPGDGYICSSKTIKPMIIENRDDWKQEIIATWSVEEMLNLETDILELFDAKNDPCSFNRHNGDGKFTSTNKVVGKTTRNKMSIARKGVLKSLAHKDAIRQSLLTGFSQGLINRPERKGDKAPNFKGYYITPTGLVVSELNTMCKEYGVTVETLRKWARLNKNGWSFMPTRETK